MKQAITGSDGSNVIDLYKYMKKKKNDDDVNDDPTLWELTDALVQITIFLDGLGHFKYSDRIAEIVGDIFEDPILSDDE
tara:strand:+ start:3478 stop:3714 length:237 start_codon:yes stop_codon:yes gene_type:complete